jgi:hypothetical protein
MILTSHTLKQEMIPFKMIIYKKKLMNQVLQKVPRIAPIAECQICLKTIYLQNCYPFCSHGCRVEWENGLFECPPR